MKKFLVIVCSASVLFMVGCSGDKVTPEDVGKQYMEKRLVGADANLTNLTYTIKDSGNDMAIVSIEGTLTYKEQISLQKRDGEWVVVDTPAEEEPVVLLEEQKAVMIVAEEKAAAILEGEQAVLLEGETAVLLETEVTAELSEVENTADLSEDESAVDLEESDVEAELSEEAVLPEDSFESVADSVIEPEDAPVIDHAPATEIAHDEPEADHASVEEDIHH